MRRSYSPLRYPGGKTKVLNFMKELININNFGDKPIYVEPYAGGAGVALGLLLEGLVSKIYINDIDLAVYSFWNSIKNDHKKFIKKIEDTPVTLEEWYKQKQIYKNGIAGFDLGFALFFLNRCNRSGIITAGCIGGKNQSGKYKIDCRFNKDTLISQITKIAKFRTKIKLYSEDTLSLLKKKKFENCLLYLDPPYYEKGSQLYKNHYKHDDHKQIANLMRKLNGKWVVSYDNVTEIKDLYKDFRRKEFGLNYSAGKIKKGKEIMFFSDDIENIPSIDLI